MAAKKKTSSGDEPLRILEIDRGELECYIVGTTPLICNAMSAKVKVVLLVGGQKKSQSERASTVKHDPLEEYRDSAYVDMNPKGPTLLQGLGSWFKSAMKGAALDVAGITKTQTGRLIQVPAQRISIYGIPELMMSVTRSADINKTPDIRTRAILPRWACKITINYVMPQLTHHAVGNLLGNAGVTQGVGDWRTEKGSGDHGQFRLVDKDDPDYRDIVKHGGRKAQEKALYADEPVYHDDETHKLMVLFHEEVERRHQQSKLKGKKKKNNQPEAVN